MTELTLDELARRVAVLEQKLARLVDADPDPVGTTGDEQSDDPEAVRRWLAAFDVIPPVVMTAEEEAAWRAAQAEQKQIDTAAIDRLAGSLPGTAG